MVKRIKTIDFLVEPTFTLDVIEEDPDDNRVLECAWAVSADFIVTGDDHLLDLKEYEGIVIMNPTEFLAALMLERGGGS